MGQVLYRKFRPKSLGEVVGQEHITKSLEHAIKTGKIAHAYLFTGPRGVGKTSVARILAYLVNNIPYDEHNSQLDIIEIDAASNRRIDEIRDLREKVNIAPSQLKYKVYIIDEVHMLTKEAFNALLKTLEEPPDHVIFILATTESHKLPNTIISRTQRFSFKPVDNEKASKRLLSIAEAEKILIDDEALKVVVAHGDGSFRDSLSLLDQLRNQDTRITTDDVQEALGIAPSKVINDLKQAIDQGDSSGLLKTLEELYEHGYQASTLAKQLSTQLRLEIINPKTIGNEISQLTLLKQLIDVPTSSSPESLLEVILLDAIFTSIDNPIGPTSFTAETQPEPVSEKIEIQPPAITNAKNENLDSPASNNSEIEKIWPDLLKIIKEKHNTLYSILRMARPELSGKTLTLHFAFKFHQQRINEPKNKESISISLTGVTGQPFEIISIFTPGTIPLQPTNDSPQEKKAKVSGENGNLQTISNIFGESQLLESYDSDK